MDVKIVSTILIVTNSGPTLRQDITISLMTSPTIVNL